MKSLNLLNLKSNSSRILKKLKKTWNRWFPRLSAKRRKWTRRLRRWMPDWISGTHRLSGFWRRMLGICRILMKISKIWRIFKPIWKLRWKKLTFERLIFSAFRQKTKNSNYSSTTSLKTKKKRIWKIKSKASYRHLKWATHKSSLRQTTSPTSLW